MKIKIDDNMMYMPVPFNDNFFAAVDRAFNLALECKTDVIFYWNNKKLIVPCNNPFCLEQHQRTCLKRLVNSIKTFIVKFL